MYAKIARIANAAAHTLATASLVLQHVQREQRERDAAGRHRAEALPADRRVVGLRADVRERAVHQHEVQDREQHAGAADRECGVPAPVILDPRRREHRHGRTDVDGHVVDRERAVDARVVAFVDAAHEVRRVRLEQPVADDDHAERRVHVGERVVRHREHQVAGAQHGRADDHRATCAEHLVADPAADRRRRIDERGERAPGEVRVAVGEAEPVDHEEDQERGHPVVAEALPHFDEKDRRERSGL
jgi:hypothetical protein